MDWLSMTIEKNAYYPIKKKPEKEGQILTLSTCSGKKKGDELPTGSKCCYKMIIYKKN